MLAFLKRRWILLSCVAVILFASTIDAVVRKSGRLPNPGPSYAYGLKAGNVRWECLATGHPDEEAAAPKLVSYPLWRFRFPSFGSIPGFGRHEGSGAFGTPYTYTQIIIPLWLPLAAILGWLCFRELRWREKRAKAAESQPGT